MTYQTAKMIVEEFEKPVGVGQVIYLNGLHIPGYYVIVDSFHSQIWGVQKYILNNGSVVTDMDLFSVKQ